MEAETEQVAGARIGVRVTDASINHALKEVDAAALAVCATPEQVVETLSYVINGTLAGRASSLAAE